MQCCTITVPYKSLLSVKLHMSHYGLSVVPYFVTMQPRNIWIPRLFWVKHIIWYSNTYINDFSKPTILYWRLFSFVRIKICSTINHLPSSILGFITGLKNLKFIVSPRSACPGYQTSLGHLLTCGISGDLSDLVEACPLANNMNMSYTIFLPAKTQLTKS